MPGNVTAPVGPCSLALLGRTRNIMGWHGSVSATCSCSVAPQLPCLSQNHCSLPFHLLPFPQWFSEPQWKLFFQDLVTYPRACLLQPHVPLTSGCPLITNYLVSEGDLFTLVILRSKCGLPENAAKEACNEPKQVYSQLSLCGVPIGRLGSGSSWAFSGKEAWFRLGKGLQAGGHCKAKRSEESFHGIY